MRIELHGKGTHKLTDRQTSQLLDRIGPVGRFNEYIGLVIEKKQALASVSGSQPGAKTISSAETILPGIHTSDSSRIDSLNTKLLSGNFAPRPSLN